MPEGKEAQAARPPRVIRVFVSSTFKDMHNEREVLIKRIFPQLRKLCESRGVVWGEVDLRWGIPDEAKAEGQVLPICLAEIHRCRPYFIGLLGERYGWVPEEIPPELIAQEPWLQEHLHHSVTELEILHGVLNNPEMADHAFFYLRDPAYSSSRAPDKRADFLETPTTEEIARFGREEAQRRVAARRGKLVALKERLRRSGLPLWENYRNPKELGEMVLLDLTELIDRLFPEGSQPAPLDREALEHEAYARSRAVVEVRPGEFSGVYIGRKEYLDRLDAHAQGDGPPLVVLGESGLGKSALLANWALGFRPRPPHQHLVMHFIGATPHSVDWAAMLRRLMAELKRRFEIPQDIPDQPDALRLAFANFLSMAAAQGRVILIIDALNQLEDRDGAPDLVWLPPVIPTNVRLILSTLPGRPLDDLTKRGWPTLKVQPLEVPERRRLIKEYLCQYRKELGLPELERLAAAPSTANPLYLRALLEELRIHGDDRTLKKHLDNYLTAPGVKDLYELILARYERDYEEDQPGLVGEALSLLSAARRGLSQAELLDLLGQEGEPMPGAVWAPLHLAVEHALMDRAGLLSFGHDYFGQAVRDQYMDTEEKRKAAHLYLADYFAAQNLTPRQVDELPWQLSKAGAWERLGEVLIKPNFLKEAWLNDIYSLKIFLTQVEKHTFNDTVELYKAVLSSPNKYDDVFVWMVEKILIDTGHDDKALELNSYLINYYRNSGELNKLKECLRYRAGILLGRGELTESLKMYEEDEQISHQTHDGYGLLWNNLHKAMVLEKIGEIESAMNLLKELEAMCGKLGYPAELSLELSLCLRAQAKILLNWGDLKGSLSILRKVENLYKQSGDKEDLSKVMAERAVIHKFLGDLDGSLKLLQATEQIFRDLGNKERLLQSLADQTSIYGMMGEFRKALTLLDEQEKLCHKLPDNRGLLWFLENKGLILKYLGKHDESIAVFREQQQVAEKLLDYGVASDSIGNQASILASVGKLNDAMNLLKEQEKLCHELGYKRGLSRCLGNQAVVFRLWGDLTMALNLLKAQEKICREIEDPEDLATSLANQAALLAQDKGQPDMALCLAEEAYLLATKHNYTIILKNIVSLLDFIHGKLDKVANKNTTKPKVTMTSNGNIICPTCKLASQKGASYCKYCKTPFF